MNNRNKAFFAIVLAVAFVLASAAILANTDKSVDAVVDNDTEVITESKTFAAGEVFELNKDYELKENVILTFEEGAILSMDVVDPWSIKGSSFSALVFEEGAIVHFVAYSYEHDNVIDEETSVGINGKVSYAIDIKVAPKVTADMTFTVDNQTVATVNGIEYNFTATSVASNISMDKIPSDWDFSEMGTLAAKLVVKTDGIKIKEAGVGEIASIGKVSNETEITFTAPTADKKEFALTLKESLDSSVNIQGVDVKVQDSADLKIRLTNITDDIDWTDPTTLGDVATIITGDASGSIRADAKSDSKFGETLAIDNAYAKYSAKFTETSIELNTEEGFDSITYFIGKNSVTVGKTFEKNDFKLELGSLLQLYSVRNIVATEQFFQTYIPDPDCGSAKRVLIAVLSPILPGADIDTEVQEIIEQLPEGFRPFVDIPFAYVLYFFEVFDEKTFEVECREIYSKVKTDDPVQTIINYSAGVRDRILAVVSGADPFEMPKIDAEVELEIGKIEVSYEGDNFIIDGSHFDASLKDNVFKASGEFKGLSFDLDNENFNVRLAIPSVSYNVAIEPEKADVTTDISGDIIFYYDDKQDEFNDIVIDFKDFKYSDKITMDQKKVTFDIDLAVGDGYASFDDADEITKAFFYLNGADCDVSGSIDIESLKAALAAQDFSLLTADATIEFSEHGLYYNQYSVVGESFKAAVDKLSGKITVSNSPVGGLLANGNVDISAAYYAGYVSSFEIGDVTAKFDFNNDRGTVDLTGDSEVILFDDGQAVKIVDAKDMAMKADVTMAKLGSFDFDLKEMSTNLTIWDYGIVSDFGELKMVKDGSTEDISFETDKVSISGNFIGGGDLKSMNGTINGVTLIPANAGLNLSDIDFTFKYADASVKIEMQSGATLELTAKPNDSTKDYNISLLTGGQGVLYYDDVPFDDFTFYSIIDSEYYQPYNDVLDIKGDVPLVSNRLDSRTMDITGKVYTDIGTLYVDEQVIGVYFNGAFLSVDYGKVGGPVFGIVAMPGYTLDPSTYEGFTVDDKGNVVPEFDEEGVAELFAVSKGNTYNITVDGVKGTAVFGKEYTLTYTGGTEPLWFVDKDGVIYGHVAEGVFVYTYEVVGDLELTSVKGTKITAGKDGDLIKVDDTGFLVVPNGNAFTVETKDGARFIIDELGDDYLKFSAVKTSYDGKTAFNLDGNSPVLVALPIKTEDAFVSHVINGVEVPMVTEIVYDEDTDAYYALVTAHSYSTYVIDEETHKSTGSDDNMMMYIAIAAVVLIAILAIAFVASRKKANA